MTRPEINFKGVKEIWEIEILDQTSSFSVLSKFRVFVMHLLLILKQIDHSRLLDFLL
jgi:hypothetical protein